MQLLGVRQPAAVKPESLIEASSVHNQRVALPVTNRVSVVAGSEIFRVGTGIEIDSAVRVRPTHIDDEDTFQFRDVYKLDPVRRQKLPWPCRRLATRVRLELIPAAIGIERSGPGLKWDVAELRSIGELLFCFRVGVVGINQTLEYSPVR